MERRAPRCLPNNLLAYLVGYGGDEKPPAGSASRVSVGSSDRGADRRAFLRLLSELYWFQGERKDHFRRLPAAAEAGARRLPGPAVACADSGRKGKGDYLAYFTPQP